MTLNLSKIIQLINYFFLIYRIYIHKRLPICSVRNGQKIKSVSNCLFTQVISYLEHSMIINTFIESPIHSFNLLLFSIVGQTVFFVPTA